MTITKPESAVDEWIVGCRALKEFDKQHHVWFRPMMNTVAKRILGEVAWGLKWRVSMGAGLSVMDIISDAYMIYQYLTSEEEGQAIFGFINLGMVAASLLIQLLIVYGQNHKKGVKKMAEGIRGYKDCLHDDEVYEHFYTAVSRVRKASSSGVAASKKAIAEAAAVTNDDGVAGDKEEGKNVVDEFIVCITRRGQ